MSGLNATEQILNFAIERELEANKFYTNLANNISKSHLAKLFNEFAGRRTSP